MIKAAFFILRLFIAIGALVVLAGTTALFLFENLIELIKGGIKLAVGIVTVFASGFRKSADPPVPHIEFSPKVVGVAIAFLAIFASVFTPGQKIFLHIVAAMAVCAAAWDIYRSTITPNHEILYLPVIVLWFVYYIVCLRRG